MTTMCHHSEFHSQDGYSCLMRAVLEEKLEIVKYLCEVGGKELMMLQDKVWPISASHCRTRCGP